MSEINSTITEELVACNDCGQQLPRARMSELYHYGSGTGNYVCTDCSCNDERYYTCEQCGELYDENEDAVTWAYNWLHDLVPVCERCAEEMVETCDECGDSFLNSAIREDEAGHMVCEDCYNESYTTCERCGTIIPRDDSYEYDGSTYCQECYEEVYTPEYIREYHSRPVLQFHYTQEDCESDAYFDDLRRATKLTPYYGCELEMDDGDVEGCAEELYQISDEETLGYMNHDGSLSSCGIEFITMPCTLRFHLQKYPWEKISRAAMGWNYRSHDASESCGLHVHVDRRAFGTSQMEQEANIAKVIILVDRFWKQMVKFSRRNINQLEHWAKKPSMEAEQDDDATVKAKFDNYKCAYDRYRAVNLKNQDTVEFRLFRGTLKVNTIKATLEFLDNLIKFANTHSLKSIQMCSFADICNYNVYPELTQYLAERNLVESAPAAISDPGEDDEVDRDDEYEDEDDEEGEDW